MSGIEKCLWVSMTALSESRRKVIKQLQESEDEFVVVTLNYKPVAALVTFDRLDRLVAAEEILKKHTQIELEDAD